MNFMKALLSAAVRFTAKARALGHAVADAVKRRCNQPALDALEAERLDRIRNPDKYLGK